MGVTVSKFVCFWARKVLVICIFASGKWTGTDGITLVKV